MKVVIIDYGAGNVFSVTTALQRLGVQAVLSSDVRLIVRADRVIFPGVGQAAAAMKQLKDKGLDRIIPGNARIGNLSGDAVDVPVFGRRKYMGIGYLSYGSEEVCRQL